MKATGKVRRVDDYVKIGERADTGGVTARRSDFRL